MNTLYKCPISEKYVLQTANINPIPKIRNTNNMIGIIAKTLVKWNCAPVINITPNNITKDIKKLINS